MVEKVAVHYSGSGGLAEKIARGLRDAGKNPETLKTVDLAPVDEFHFRGRPATLELAEQMKLSENAHVLDIGSGLGGASRTVAEEYGCRVTGIDLTEAFCEAAASLSDWVGLAERTEFRQGDATNLPFPDDHFDAAMTLHVAMNIPAKDRLYEQARRVLKPGGIFAVYDILQGEGGAAIYPAPWAQEASISHLASPAQMESLLGNAGFKILSVHDSTAESLSWLQARSAAKDESTPVPVTTQILFGDSYRDMVRNQAIGLQERRIRTVSYLCQA